MERIYTSPFKRSLETAQIIAKIQNITDPILVNEFREIGDMQPTGILVEDVAHGKVPWPTPIEFESVADRMMHGLQTVVDKEKGHTVGIVSHGDPIRCLIFRVMYPDAPMPGAAELFATDYIDKGEAWRLVVDNNVRLVEREYIGRPPEAFGKGERHR